MLFMASTEPEQFTAGPHKAFLLVPRNRTEQQWLKGSWILKKQVPNFKNKLRQTGINFFRKLVSSCSDVVQIEHWYLALCVQWHEQTDIENYTQTPSNSCLL